VPVAVPEGVLVVELVRVPGQELVLGQVLVVWVLEPEVVLVLAHIQQQTMR